MKLENIKNGVFLKYAVVFLISVFLYTWGWRDNATLREWGDLQVRESSGVAWLFLLPLVMQGGGLLYLWCKPVESEESQTFFDFYLSTMILCAIFNYGLWIIYLEKVQPKNHMSADGWPAQWFSVGALAFVVILLAFVAILTLSFMTPHDKKDSEKLFKYLRNIKVGAARRPFWTLLHSMSVFLTVTFLFAFAFAFHDLMVPKLPVSKADSRGGGGQTQSPAALPPLYMASLPNYSKLDHRDHEDPECLNFRFAEGDPALGMFNETRDAGIVEDYSRLMNPGAKPLDPGLVDRHRENRATMNRAVTRLIEIAKKGRQSYVLLVGHADDKRVRQGGPFSDNYALSRARVEDVMRQMKWAAYSENTNRWINAEWEIIAWSNAESPQARDSRQRACGIKDISEDGRMVEVFITPILEHPFKYAMERYRDSDFQRLDLLDHIYFSTYTITTTGYGDIIPTTRYTKFLACLANICEVFFIVGLFNSLMALKYNPDEDDKPG